MNKITFAVCDDTLFELMSLKERMLTDNVSYIVRVSIHEKFLCKTVSSVITNKSHEDYSFLASDISDLPGMDLDVVESHFVRFRKYHPTVEVYRAAIEAVKRDASEKGEPVRNPEAALYGKLKAWSCGKWTPYPMRKGGKEGGRLLSRDEIERELYGAK